MAASRSVQRLDASPDPPLGRLDGVIDYLIFLVERQAVRGESAEAVLRAAELLREAILHEEPLWGQEVD
jgi:hypothetical protein